VVQEPPGLPRQLVEVAGVQADPDLAGGLELADHVDRVPHALERVVRVHEERRPAGVILRERPERVALVVERGDERVRHRPGDR
jgi:hypothetical protein